MDSARGFPRQHARRLQQFLSLPGNPDGTMTYPELAGFLFAVCCAPELIMPSEWLPMVFNDGEPVYATEKEANAIVDSMMALYRHVNDGVAAGSPDLPTGCEPCAEAVANLEETAPLRQWASGFAEGYHYLLELWDPFVKEGSELDKELGALTMMLMFFSSREFAEALVKESVRPDSSIEDFAGSILLALPEAMCAYARVGRALQGAQVEGEIFTDADPKAIRIDRDAPCPCGSGRKFKHCCGGPATLH
ncbi:MAG: UPF0149 family protein [Gammaproteobacteria bacterium]